MVVIFDIKKKLTIFFFPITSIYIKTNRFGFDFGFISLKSTKKNQTEKTKPNPKKTESNQKNRVKPKKTEPNQFGLVFVLKNKPNQTETGRFEPVLIYVY
jgi:hypothetical protein